MPTLEITRQRADVFAELHVRGKPLCLFNCHDVASAQAAAKFGPAVATGSGAAAFAQGYDDGQKIPVDYVLGLASRIAASVDCPTTIDFEAGYTEDLDEIADHIRALINAGIVGINLEDSLHDGQKGLAELDAQIAKIERVRQIANEMGVNFFINARSDAYIHGIGDADTCLEETLRRGAAYAQAGASGLFVPFLVDLEAIAAIADQISLPLNILGFSKAPSVSELANAGVSRISLGGWGFEVAMAAFSKQAKIFAETGAYPSVEAIE